MIRLLKFLWPWWGAPPAVVEVPGRVCIDVEAWGCITHLQPSCSLVVSTTQVGGCVTSVIGDILC